MNGVHDMGGMQGFGPVVGEDAEPTFHAPWEGRVLGLQRALLYTRAWNIDVFRHAQEQLPGATYLTVSYYHRWLLSLSRTAVERGLVTQEELDAGRALGQARPVQRTLGLREVGAAFIRGAFGRTPAAEARFAPGDRVRTRNLHPPGHTRLPRYARDPTRRAGRWRSRSPGACALRR